MTRRLIIGKHPLDGSYGIWLSIPGVDAASTTNPTQFLICPGVKNDMVLMVGVSGSGIVYFPETFSSKPAVIFQPTTSGGTDYYPFNIGVLTKYGECECYVTTSYMQFNDGSGLGLQFMYLVTNRALP